MITGVGLDPDRVTEILGLQPTSLKHGDPLAEGRRERISTWFLTVDDGASITSGAQHFDLLQALLSQIEGRAANFVRLHDEAAPETVTIYGGFHIDGSQQNGLWLEPQQMKILADCGIGWGLDLFATHAPTSIGDEGQ